MRTIIVNTLGGDMPLHELLFLPFRDDQFVWLNTNMGEIGACAQKIEACCNVQDKRQDYRLVVLADLGGYADIDTDEIRSCYRSILGAYLNKMLFVPLAGERMLPPRHITLVYMVSGNVRGSGRITAGRYYDYVLNLPEDKPFCSLALVRFGEDGREARLDITAVFADFMKACRVCDDYGDDEKHRTNVNYFRKQLPDKLRELCKCSYTIPGSMQSEIIPVAIQEYFPQCSDRELMWVDVQLNISRMLARQSRMRRDAVAELKLHAHGEEELAFRFRRGLLRVRKLLKEAPAQTYFPLEAREGPDPVNLYNRIWKALLEKKALLPGVQEADDHRQGKESAPKEWIGSKLRRAWIRMDREKKQFEALCDALDREYDPDVVRQQQQQILDICAEEFRDWRSSVLAGRPVPPEESRAVAGSMPALNTAQTENRLRQAQVRCSAIAADKLEDYLDLRQEAEEIKADFRKTASFWKPDCKNSNTKYFLTYSAVLAAVFLIQMLLPYALITLGQADAGLGNYLHLFVSGAVFAGAYLLGLLLWLRQTCRALGEHSQRMAALILRSGLRRRDSIEAVVKRYGEELPQCALLHRELRQLRMLDSLNMERYARCGTHMELLSRAEEMLLELQTQLQLPMPAMERLYTPEQVIRGIDYQKAPSEPENIPYYMLLSDDWGDGVC